MGWWGRGRGGKEVSEEGLGDYPIMGRGRTKDGRNEGRTKRRMDERKDGRKEERFCPQDKSHV